MGVLLLLQIQSKHRPLSTSTQCTPDCARSSPACHQTPWDIVSLSVYVLLSDRLLLTYSEIVLLHHHYTSLTLHESALSNASIMSKNLNFQQLEYLYGCLEATKSWFNLFLTIPSAEYTGFPFSIFAQMVHNLVVLYQLSVFEDPAWDVNTVRQSANVLSILSTVIESMSQVASLAGLEGESDSDIFSRVAKMYQSVLMGWEEKMGPESLPLSSMQSTQSLPEPLDSMPFNFPMVGDNDWLSDMLNSITQSN